MPFFVPGDVHLDLQTKHVFRVNLVQIRSAVSEIFHTQTKKHRLTAPKTEPSAVHCMQLQSQLNARKTKKKIIHKL